jgi:hypothetical protein
MLSTALLIKKISICASVKNQFDKREIKYIRLCYSVLYKKRQRFITVVDMIKLTYFYFIFNIFRFSSYFVII